MDVISPLGFSMKDSQPSFGMDVDCDMGDDEACMSDRLVPLRRTCSSVGQMIMGPDDNWKPQNENQDALSHNVLGKESLANTKVLSYKHKPQCQQPLHNDLQVLYSSNRDTTSKPKPNRVIPQSAIRVLDAPGMLDDFYAHPLDWSSSGMLAVALSHQVFLFDVASGQTRPLLSLPSGNVTSLRWTGQGDHVSVGTSLGDLQIWDGYARRESPLRILRGHTGRIGAVAWHEHVLSSGAADAEIHHHDVRVRDSLVGRIEGAHADLVCGLDYSADGVLASGGNDNAVCVWESGMQRSPLHTLTEHRAAVKALRWCPWQRNMLATGGGSADKQLCIWNASSGRLAKSVDTESQVTDIIWALQEKELVTAHGYSRNQLSMWKYPSLTKAADLEGHTGRLLGLAQSPDGAVVASASADETLRFWRAFTPLADKKRSRERQDAPNPILRSIR